MRIKENNQGSGVMGGNPLPHASPVGGPNQEALPPRPHKVYPA